MRRIVLAIAAFCGLLWAVPASATCVLPYTFGNGKIADANQVNADFNAVISCIVAQGPGGINPQVQYNNAGAFGGLTDPALTLRIQLFTSLLSGAVPAPLTVNGYFLKDNGTWAAVPGAPCTTTSNTVQYDNAGNFGCAPMIDNSGVMDLTGTNSATLQFLGTPGVFFDTTHLNFGLMGVNFPAFSGGGATDNICIGYGDFGNNACHLLTTAANNTIMGFDAGYSITAGSTNTFIGYLAGNLDATGHDNTNIGESAGANNVGSHTVALGDGALTGNASGDFSNSTAIGNGALQNVHSGASFNVALGDNAGNAVTTGTGNLLLGNYAGETGSGTQLTTGSSDIIISAAGNISHCGPSSSSVSNELDLCGNSTSDTTPVVRANITSLAAGSWLFGIPDSSPAYTVSTLPASPPKGSRAYVTDATGCSFAGAPTGGGTTFCPEIFDGSAWHGG